jgi:K+ transporter
MKGNTPTSLHALFALGVDFGDIGTNPLYAFQQSATGAASEWPIICAVIGSKLARQ